MNYVVVMAGDAQGMFSLLSVLVKVADIPKIFGYQQNTFVYRRIILIL